MVVVKTVPVTRYADRLMSETYAEDEPVHVFCPETDAEAWIPESLFDRLQSVARGYRLHVIPLLAEDALRFLSVAQAQSLADELAFVAEVSNDPALHEQLDAISRVASDGIHHAAKAAVAFEWP